MKDRLRQSALALSGGQQQRLCIARALANEPEVLLLDEPASALDPIATQKIEELLYELKQELTIVIVTHNLQQAARVSDYTAFFYLGRLVEVDATEPDLHEPARGAHRGIHHREIRMSPSRRAVSPLSRPARRRSSSALLDMSETRRSGSWISPWKRCSTRDAGKAEAVIAGDSESTRWRSRSSSAAIALLALQQPMARDLRFIVSAIKVSSDLERVGDHAVNIAQSALRLIAMKSNITPDPEIEDMARRARAMLGDALDAFIRADGALGREVCRADDAVDALHDSRVPHPADAHDGGSDDASSDRSSCCS